MVLLKMLPGLGLLLLAGIWSVPAQVPPEEKTPPVFSMLNLIRSPQPATLKIGSVPVGEGPMSFGFYTGVVTWIPTIPLVVEAPGFGALRIPFTPAGAGECPLLIVQDALEKSPGGGDPKPVLKFLSIPNARNREAGFTDGLNLTSRETLSGTIGGKTVSLPKGKRTRLSTANGFVLNFQDSPEVAVSPSEQPGTLLVIFYENLEGKIEFALTNDVLIRP